MLKSSIVIFRLLFGCSVELAIEDLSVQSRA